MKKSLRLLLLFAAMMITCGQAFAVEKEVIINGDLEGTDVSCFVAKEPPATDPAPATIVDGVGVDGSRGIKVSSVDDDPNEEKPQEDWATQFWIKLPRPLMAGDEFRIKFDYRATKAAHTVTQAHSDAPGNYIHWAAIGDVDFTTEWQHLDRFIEVTDLMDGEHDEGMQYIAFSLAMLTDNEGHKVANDYFFDNFSIIMDDGTAEPGTQIITTQFVVNGNLEGDDFSSFRVLDVTSGSVLATPGPTLCLVEDEKEQGNHCLKLVAPANPKNPWDAQFFVTFGEQNALHEGDIVNFSMRVRRSADNDNHRVSSEVHAGPGEYIDWHAFGDFYPTEEWRTWEKENMVVTKDQNGFYSLAFTLCNDNPTASIEYYFDDISFEKVTTFIPDESPAIQFKDPKVKAICVSRWDNNGDGELGEKEAARVKKLGGAFQNSDITSFDELQYFTGLNYLDNIEFTNCQKLVTITLPNNLAQIGVEAFYGCKSLTAITIPASVSTLGYDMFGNCGALTSLQVDADNPYFDSRNNCNAIIMKKGNVLIASCKTTVVPAGVEAIGYLAFFLYDGETVVLPSTVTAIDTYAFQSSSITSFVVPASVTSIGQHAFEGCRNLTSLSVEDGNPVYDSRNNCNAIIRTNYNELQFTCSASTIPEGVTSIGQYAFAYQTMSAIAIPNTVTTIKSQAFYNVYQVPSIIIPESVTSIGYQAFWSTHLQEVIVRNSVPFDVDEEAFYKKGETPTKTLWVPAGSKETYENSSIWSSQFKEIKEVEPDASTKIVFASTSTKAVCVSNWDTNKDGELSMEEAAAVKDLGYVFVENNTVTSFDEFQYFTGITAINSLSFRDCPNLTAITIPASVTNIDSWSFMDCPSLVSLKVAEGNEYFDSRDDCNAIIRSKAGEGANQVANEMVKGCKATTFPASVPRIGQGAFRNCTSLTSVIIPTTISSIGSDAYYGCTNLASVTISKSVTSIEDNAFIRCGITTLTVDKENTVYDSRDNCNAVIRTEFNELRIGCKTTVIPNTVTSIGHGAFRECLGLVTIDIPTSVQTLGQWVFQSCPDLTAVVIPSSVTFIVGPLFSYCNSLTSITVDENNPNYDSRNNCNAIIQKEDNILISACDATIIPNTVETIGLSAFNGCEQTETVAIPASVTNIESNAFAGMSNLKEVVVRSSVPCTLGAYVFSHNNWNPKTLFVPKGSAAAYTAADGWKEFPTITEYTLGDANGDGNVTITDAVAIVNCILGNASAQFDLMAADVNGDGVISITDAVAVVNIILNQGGAGQN